MEIIDQTIQKDPRLSKTVKEYDARAHRKKDGAGQEMYSLVHFYHK